MPDLLFRAEDGYDPREVDEGPRRLARASVAWVFVVRTSVAEAARAPHSLRGQVATALWTLRERAHRRWKADEALVEPEQIFLGLAAGSKMYPRRIETVVVGLVRGGKAFRFFRDFAHQGLDTGAYPLPEAIANELGSKQTRSAVVREILDAAGKGGARLHRVRRQARVRTWGGAFSRTSSRTASY